MKDMVLHVGPAGSGWGLACDGYLEPTYYRSGAEAERSARFLARHITGLGCDVQVLVRDRSECLIASHRYFGLRKLDVV